MYNESQICEKIRKIYPDIGNCGVDLDVQFSEANRAWEVNLKQGHRHLKTFLDDDDANHCMEGRQCIGLGLQVYQLRDNIRSMRFS